MNKFEPNKVGYTGPSCSDHGCRIRKPKGMGTNGGCRCVMGHGQAYVRWLENKVAWLECLEAAGVDNWQGIDEAIELHNES